MTEHMPDAELRALLADVLPTSTVGVLVADLLESRAALAECGEKLAHRDKKIAELRELIHAGAMPAGATSAKQSAKRPPRR